MCVIDDDDDDDDDDVFTISMCVCVWMNRAVFYYNQCQLTTSYKGAAHFNVLTF